MAGRRERDRWASGTRPETPGRSAPRGPGRWARAGFDRKSWVAVLFGVVLGVGLLVIGIDAWHDHRVLQARGVVTTGQIVAVRTGKAVYLTVRFATATGERITADVTNPSTKTKREVGAPISLRYDPEDPAGRVADADDDRAVQSRWLLVVGGAGLLTAIGWATLWRPFRLDTR
ncbi:hypothetical protein GCM10010399_29200 [Dactylosporangium fulvum]|uniref:DUF3592 domain-containing protein n=1 Tax=Dactylosporangium fulvum TaxID=53359 RepID=A0ABY5W9P4_9ACTN|nr:DUF3592 domain-containing protein [Dactylosporangium fulvum]UWP86214.1 DUF3592 domain-containing protein [Dactylosporangium fulvum]